MENEQKSIGEMTREELYQRVEPDDPNRCQSNTSKGQCRIRAVPSTRYCVLHKGTAVLRKMENESRDRYRLGVWQTRVKELGGSTAVKSLRDEIGILRMMLEERFQFIKDSHDMILHSHVISEMILKIERVVTSCHKIEKSMGELLDKSDILRIAEHFMGSVNEILEGQPENVKAIADAFEKALEVPECDDEF